MTPPPIPRPEGWIGTASEWAQGLGVALAILNLIVLALAWRASGRGGETRALKTLLFFGIAVLPVMVTYLGYQHGFESAKTVRSCGACHVMTPYLGDLQDMGSQSLAAVHYKNRYIQEHHCYTCHSDYGMMGDVRAKLAGVRHVTHYVARSYVLPLKIAHPYPNLRCLGCHGESQKFLTSDAHPRDVLPQLIGGQLSCLDCHGPAHSPKKVAGR